MPHLRNKETGLLLGQISEEQLQFLIDHLEEESSGDKDYYINNATIDMLKEEGADTDLLELLEHALGGQDGIEIEWN